MIPPVCEIEKQNKNPRNTLLDMCNKLMVSRVRQRNGEKGEEKGIRDTDFQSHNSVRGMQCKAWEIYSIKIIVTLYSDRWLLYSPW